MKKHVPLDKNFEARVRESFSKQTIMNSIGAELKTVEPGRIVIEMPFNKNYCQQNGFLHAGVITTIVDSACGYAAISLMPEGSDALTVEFKINLLSPAVGEKIVAIGKVIKAGKTITISSGEVFSVNNKGEQKQIALMQATLIKSNL